jgi:hypothetical protein
MKRLKRCLFRIISGFILLVLVLQSANAQKVSNIDFDQVKAVTTDSTSKFFYQYLLEKVANYDGYISQEEFHYLYYGNAFYDAYSPYGMHDDHDPFKTHLAKKEYQEAIPFGKNILAENPVNLAITYDMLVCYHELAVKDTARIYAERYYNMLEAIANSGDGKSPETAFVVLKVNDEYQMLYYMQLDSEGQSLLYTEFGPVDKLKIARVKKKKGAEGQKVKEVYFNVTLLFERMKLMMGSEDE